MQQCYMGTMTSPREAFASSQHLYVLCIEGVEHTFYTRSMLLKYEISHISLDNIFVLEDQDDH